MNIKCITSNKTYKMQVGAIAEITVGEICLIPIIDEDSVKGKLVALVKEIKTDTIIVS